MHPDSKSFTRWWWAGVLGVCLIGGPAEAMRDKCQDQCSRKANEALQACVQDCPAPRRGQNMDEFQACSKGCSSKFNKAIQDCSSRCNDDKKREGKSKNKKTPPPRG